jgi:hypothetical protein
MIETAAFTEKIRGADFENRNDYWIGIVNATLKYTGLLYYYL